MNSVPLYEWIESLARKFEQVEDIQNSDSESYVTYVPSASVESRDPTASERKLQFTQKLISLGEAIRISLANNSKFRHSDRFKVKFMLESRSSSEIDAETQEAWTSPPLSLEKTVGDA